MGRIKKFTKSSKGKRYSTEEKEFFKAQYFDLLAAGRTNDEAFEELPVSAENPGNSRLIFTSRAENAIAILAEGLPEKADYL